MLYWKEDIQPMIEATKNARDAALITVAWDSGDPKRRAAPNAYR